MTESVTGTNGKKPLQVPQLMVFVGFVMAAVAVFGSLILPGLAVGLCVIAGSIFISISLYSVTVAAMDLKEAITAKK